MAFLSAIPFFAWAAMHMVSLAVLTRIIANSGDHFPQWKACHFVTAAGLVFVILDCVRIGLGGFWESTSLEDVPPLHWLYACSIITHLMVVPWFVWIQAEFYIAIKWKVGAVENDADTPCEVWFRRISLAVSGLIMVLLAFNLYAHFDAYLKHGYERSHEFGVVKYKWPEEVKEMGYTIFVFDLLGVITFATSAVVVGGIIWCRTGWPWYFVTALIGLLGQAAGPATPPWFRLFLSNFFEVFSFAGMVISTQFLFVRSKEMLNEPAEVEQQSFGS